MKIEFRSLLASRGGTTPWIPLDIIIVESSTCFSRFDQFPKAWSKLTKVVCFIKYLLLTKKIKFPENCSQQQLDVLKSSHQFIHGFSIFASL
jgi:hypothetical protein